MCSVYCKIEAVFIKISLSASSWFDHIDLRVQFSYKFSSLVEIDCGSGTQIKTGAIGALTIMVTEDKRHDQDENRNMHEIKMQSLV